MAQPIRVLLRLFTITALLVASWVEANQPSVLSEQAVTTVKGADPVMPAVGTPGLGNNANWIFYNVPGEVLNTKPPGGIVGAPYTIAYSNPGQPVQTSDWWIGVGLQWQGWVLASDPVVRSHAFVNQPFEYQFLDLPESRVVPGLDLPVQGLRFWNQVDMDIFTGSSDASGNFFGRGAIADQRSPVLTVGLEGVHPISEITPDVSATPPWTNIAIDQYSDWGVELSYGHDGNQLSFTLINGSPFAWVERTRGSVPFRIWAGTDDADPNGKLDIWYNQDGVFGVTVTNSYVSPAPENPLRTSTGAYVIYADDGVWTEQQSTNPNAPMALFANAGASKVVVAAMPHNIDLGNTDALIAAARDLEPFAWQRIVHTQLHYPPISGSKSSVVIDGKSEPLGYQEGSSLVRTLMEVTTENFDTGESGGDALQLVFPHQRQAMIPEDRNNIWMDQGKPKYTWRSLKGELQAYVGNGYVRELTARGMLPFLPSTAVNSSTKVNGQLPAEEIYAALKTWFFQGEPNTGGLVAPFMRGIAQYLGFQNNTYMPNMPGVFETLVIADQLAQAESMKNQSDPDIGKPKAEVAAEIRDVVLQSLKELIGQWADIYTSQFFQYNPEFNTSYGFPQGFGSVQNFNDKHFHWGYFLRAAAAIGRYDPAWVKAHKPLFEQLQADVANYDRDNTAYPFLRNFSPFYGHNWANGLANEGIGDDQESTGEAINFAVGLIELGQVLGNKDWVDVGMYLYEEEILATEQYWFNQDADLAQRSETFYNGNWPEKFVHYRHDGDDWISSILGQVFQTFMTRATFFGSEASPPFVNAYVVQAIPLGAPALYLGRNQEWLMQTWEQFVREAKTDDRETAYEVLIAGLQSRLPGQGTDITDPGPLGALTRINREHPIYPGAVNVQGKHWAYSNAVLGPLDSSVIADTASYGVFCQGATQPHCADGTRTYVAYNPADSETTVTFTDTNTQATTNLAVPAHSLATRIGETVSVDRLASAGGLINRSYLLKDKSFSVDCGPLPEQTLAMELDPGDWMLADGESPYPVDTALLDDSLVCVPARPDDTGTNVPPESEYVRSWSTRFDGQLNLQSAVTRFGIYTNQSLFPGWQLDPCVQGGPDLPNDCPDAGLLPPNGPGANALTMQFSYDFDSDGQPDRIEQYRNASLSLGNTFTYDSKQTEYKFNQIWPFTGPPMIVGGPDGTKTAPFPRFIPQNQPATLTVEMWGGTITGGVEAQFPVPISVNADPLTNRASWIKPPYALCRDEGQALAFKSAAAKLPAEIEDCPFGPDVPIQRLRGLAGQLGQGDRSAGLVVSGRLSLPEGIDLRTASLTLKALLFEAGGANELVRDAEGALISPLTLTGARNNRSNYASYHAKVGRTVIEMRIRKHKDTNDLKRKNTHDFKLRVKKAALPNFPKLCSRDGRRTTTTLITLFTLEDTIGANFVGEGTWECKGFEPQSPKLLWKGWR